MSGQLRDQIKQPRPFASLEAEAFVNVLRTASQLLGGLVELLRPHDITQPQYNVLRILRGAGAGGLPSGEVGVRMVSREPDMTRLLDRMEGRGLVARARGTVDRRVVTVRLTDAGREIVAALDGPVAELHARQLGHMSEDELQALSTLLERARAEELCASGTDGMSSDPRAVAVDRPGEAQPSTGRGLASTLGHR
jgi:DNA-binding MarR family transcriptional regulator